ncbi:2708_t:CDS:1, partial [Dentiscutata erythropus]
KMHHLDLGLFKYQVEYTRDLLNNTCEKIGIDELDKQLVKVSRFPELKVFNKGLGNIKRFTADEFHIMMKVFLFVVEGIIIKHHKISIEESVANRYDHVLVDVYYRWNKIYLFNRREYFLESDLVEFK